MIKDYNKIISEYYLIALLEIKSGMTIKEAEEAIEMYIQEENYEACAGLYKALNEHKYYKNDRTDN